MMNARLNKALVGLLAVAVGACSDSPVDVGANDPEGIVTNPSFVVIEAGESRLVQTYLVNALNSPVAGELDYEACNGLITLSEDPDQTDLQPGTNFMLTAGTTLGSSCVNVSGSGHEATIQVRIVPGSIELTVSDTVASGGTSSAAVAFFDAQGGAATGFDIDEIEFSTSDEDIAVIDENGVITGRAPGEVDIIATLVSEAGADRADTFSIIVAPGTFGGTATGDVGPGGTVLTFEFTSGSLPDDDTEVTAEFDGDVYPLYPMAGTDDNTYVTRLPYGTAVGEGSVSIINLGDEQVAVNHPVEITSATANDPHEPNQTFAAGTPITLPYNNILYADTEDRFVFTTTDSMIVDVSLDWDDENGSHDLDLFVYAESLTTPGSYSAICTAASSAHPEVIANCVLPANRKIGIRVDNYDLDDSGNDGPTNYNLVITIDD